MRKISLEKLGVIAKRANGHINKIYLHWTAGNYHQFFKDYHINIDFDGTILISTEDFTDIKWHTWHRNTGAIGIALCCCVGAKANSGYNADFGFQPPTEEQIEALSKVVALLSKTLNLAITKENIMTHCEAATLDGYGPFSGDKETRWDLWYLKDFDKSMKNGGDVIRGKANWYKINKKGVIL